MPELYQRWLTADAICTLLNINKTTLYNWASKKYIVKIGGKLNGRYLDPGPEYSERLRLGRAIHDRDVFATLAKDITMVNLLTAQEFAAIMGWGLKRAKNYLQKRKTSGFRKPRCVSLYPVSEIRDIVWRFRGRKGSKKGPLLLQDFIDFFLRYQAAQDELMPSDSQFEKDDILKKKMEFLMNMPSPQREVALKEMMEKMDLAKKIVLESRLQHTPHK